MHIRLLIGIYTLRTHGTYMATQHKQGYIIDTINNVKNVIHNYAYIFK